MEFCNEGAHGAADRQTLVIFASNDGVHAEAELLFRGSKADGSRAADFDPEEVPADLTVTFAPRATNTTECSESMVERNFPLCRRAVLRKGATGYSSIKIQDT